MIKTVDRKAHNYRERERERERSKGEGRGMEMDMRKIVVIVEDADAARTALKWALHNLLRHGDVITLLHVFCPEKPRSRNRTRLLRLEGYQLALSFKDLCSSSSFFNTNLEIVVTEGDRDGKRIAAMVREIGAFALVVGLHDQSFLYKLALTHNNIASSFNCRVLAIKQETLASRRTSATPSTDAPTNMDFSQIEIGRLHFPDITPPPKVPYRICPDPFAIIWRRRKSRRKRS